MSPAAYADGISTPAVGNAARPSARQISNAVADQGSEDIVSQRQLSAMIYAWGQFLDHDLDLTTSAVPKESFPVRIPTGDPSFDPGSTGQSTIPLSRSAFDPATGTSKTNPRQQVNSVTSWIDGSQIYGSDAVTADKLRTHVGGKLKTSEGNLLPYNNAATFPTGTLGMANDAHVVPDSELFAAGDVRANENIELLSLQTLFVREHNRVADKLAQANHTWTDEQLYQEARKVVIGELQAITYNEWLPALLGAKALQPYRGYNSAVNPAIANEFSTAAFRLGHSMLGDDVEFLDNNVFYFKVDISGQVFQDANRDGRLGTREAGLAGRTVQLLDPETKEVLATTTTDSGGCYRFDTTNGLGVGEFLVREVLPQGSKETTRAIPAISITRGDTLIRNVNFGVASTTDAPIPPVTSPRPADPRPGPGPHDPQPHPHVAAQAPHAPADMKRGASSASSTESALAPAADSANPGVNDALANNRLSRSLPRAPGKPK